MALAAKNGSVPIGDTQMAYIRFGTGKKHLILIPGLGDGLRTIRGTALPMALMYGKMAEGYTVWSFSRRDSIPAGWSTADMARDQAQVMDLLGIEQADIVGVSMGGMIAQHLAAAYPEKVRKLVLVVTAPRPNPILLESVEEWVSLARKGDHTAFVQSNLERIYSQDYCRKNRWMVPLTAKLTKPKSYARFFAQAEACRVHDAWDMLPRITAPTLVIGGEQDLALGAEASRLLAAQIPGAELKLYEQWGHGLYEEASDFQDTVLDFLR